MYRPANPGADAGAPAWFALLALAAPTARLDIATADRTEVVHRRCCVMSVLHGPSTPSIAGSIRGPRRGCRPRSIGSAACDANQYRVLPWWPVATSSGKSRNQRGGAGFHGVLVVGVSERGLLGGLARARDRTLEGRTGVHRLLRRCSRLLQECVSVHGACAPIGTALKPAVSGTITVGGRAEELQSAFEELLDTVLDVGDQVRYIGQRGVCTTTCVDSRAVIPGVEL